MLIEVLSAIQDLPPVVALRFSRWTYAFVNAGHIVGIALLFGALLPLDLRLIGLWRSIPIRTLARILVPVAAAGLVLAVSAGALLFSIRAVEYAGLTLFALKLSLIICALANAMLLRLAGDWNAGLDVVGAVPPPRLRAAGALSIGLWLSVIVCGRLLAFQD
jgi:hypothetical protein